MGSKTPVTLTFTHEFGEREAYEAEAKGYLSYAVVVLDNRRRIPVFFWDAVRLQQELKSEIEDSVGFIAEPGMIVLESITLENMEKAVQRLYLEGFFDSFVSV